MNPFFQCVKVAGGDARAFLQGQLTQDVRRLVDHPVLSAAWCNPKGRVLSVMRMLEVGAEIDLVVPGSLAESVVKRLLLYRLRAKVTIDIAGPDWAGMAVAGEDDLAALAALGLLPDRKRNASRRAYGLAAVDTGAAGRCVEVYGTTASFEKSGLDIRQPLTDSSWQKALIEAGVPTIVAATSEKYTPHMLNLDCTGALSFDKGCYTGQEIVARTQHLGSSRRRLMHYRIDGGTAAIGEKLEYGAREVGEIVNIVQEDLLAVVPLELHSQTLAVNGRPAIPVELPYSLSP